jgi:hypothetical protein
MTDDSMSSISSQSADMESTGQHSQAASEQNIVAAPTPSAACSRLKLLRINSEYLGEMSKRWYPAEEVSSSQALLILSHES